MSIAEDQPKICAICQGIHYFPKSGFQHGTFHQIGKKKLWIGSECFASYTCMIAEGYFTFEKVPTKKELYRVYQRYGKKHQLGEPWWNGVLYLDNYEKKRYFLDRGIQAFMEREL